MSAISRPDRIRICIMLGVAAMSLAARLAAQQDARFVANGTHIRVSAPPRFDRVQGVLLQNSPDSLRIVIPGAVRPDTIALAQGAVSSIMVRRRAGSQVLWGAGVGLLGGVAFWAIASSSSGCGSGQYCFQYSAGTEFAGAALLGTAVGTVIGLIVPRYHWDEVQPAPGPVPFAIVPAPGGNGAGVRLALPPLR